MKNAHLGFMRREGLTESHTGKWTQPEDYLRAMARKRSFRRGKRRERTQPEAPRMLLSTAPFLALMALLGVLAAAIMVLAFPGSQPQQQPQQVAQKEQGVAAKGWFQEAERDFHH